MAKFKDLLKSIRESKGMTQAELSEASGVSQQNISRWEKGRTQPKWAEVQKLCRALKVSCSRFMETEDAPPGAGGEENEGAGDV